MFLILTNVPVYELKEFIKPLLQHNNLQKFPNATSITSSVGLDKTLAVPVITLVLTAEWNQ